MGLEPAGKRLADGGPGIFLDEMRALHRRLGLVFTASAEFARRADQDAARTYRVRTISG
jgi:hypothetical protein